MKIAVVSGKGGTGKTFVSVNLAAVAPAACYLDCDVEEPNGHLFFKPEEVQQERVYTRLPVFDEKKCTQCRLCIDFCRFNALAFWGGKPQLFGDVCHSCGGCALLCPSGAITETEHEIGHIECGIHKNVRVVTGVLNVGEASGVPIIASVLEQAPDDGENPVMIDCPPGSACTVMESVASADYCILVGEPTVFGMHNFEMVYELVRLLGKPCGVVINKAPEEETPLDDLCKRENLSILCRIPYREKTALLGARGSIAVEEDEELCQVFTALWSQVRREVAE